MQDAHIIDGLERKFSALAGDLDERGRRRWAASEALELGYGGRQTGDTQPLWRMLRKACSIGMTGGNR